MKKHLFLLISIVCVLSSCRHKEEVDLILHNAKIYTVNNSFAVMQSAAIKDGKFVAVSSDATISTRYTSDSILDLKGKFVYPGFIDSHAHFINYAISLSYADMLNANELSDVIHTLTSYKQANPNKWIIAKNLDTSLLNNNTLLNELFPDTPVFIWSSECSSAIVNNAFAQHVDLKENVNGLIVGEELKKASKQLPKPSQTELVELLQKAEKECFAVGITSTSDFESSLNDIKIIDSLHKTNCLQIPIYMSIEPTTENIDAYISKIPYYTDKLKVLSVAIDIDGRALQQEALMLQPYKTGGNGIQNVTADSLYTLCQMAYDNGFQVCADCQGDSAARLVLNTYAKILPNKNDMRWRIENTNIMARAEMRKLSHYNVIPSVSPLICNQKRTQFAELFDKKQKKDIFAWKQIIAQDQGILCNSNAPYGDMNPTAIYYAAMRQERQKQQNIQSQEMSPIQALKAMTIWPAYAQFDEKQKGSIEVGKWADFIVLPDNITTMYKPNLPNVKVEKTYLRGKKVYENQHKEKKEKLNRNTNSI